MPNFIEIENGHFTDVLRKLYSDIHDWIRRHNVPSDKVPIWLTKFWFDWQSFMTDQQYFWLITAGGCWMQKLT